MNISAIILAAGESKRMGQPKMTLKWGESTVLEHVISIFAKAGLDDILVVTGSHKNEVDEIVFRSKKRYPVRSIFNEDFASGEMLSSIQRGLRVLTPPPLSRKERGAAAMIGLGDQPQVQEGSVRMVCDAFQKTGNPLVVPSYQMRRGHPWLIARELWNDFLAITHPQTPRDFLRANAEKIQYVEVDTESILLDLDTPQDYQSATRS
jgi:molybdenum cofactor cytidylyltransferase